jgi:mono/diheme cytochrome c family protein
MNAFAFGAILLLLQASPSVAPHEDAKVFEENCGACHSIGGGDGAGPDLIRVKSWPADDVRKAVIRMQENSGPLTGDQIDELVEFLRKDDGAQMAEVEIAPEQKAASAAIGKKLFYGETPLANRGTPCFGCHAVAGRGGNLAIDLTNVHARRGEAALVAATEKPAFPLMKGAYVRQPLTKQEAWHLAAFFKESAKAQPAKDPAGAVHGAGAGVAFIVLAGVALIFRPRRGR